MDGWREAGRQGVRVGRMGGAIAPPVCDERLFAREQKPETGRGVWLRAEVGSCWSADLRWCVAIGFAPRTSDGSSLHMARVAVTVRLSIQARCPALSSPVCASPLPKSRARTSPMDLGVFRQHQGKHRPTPPTSHGRTALRPISVDLAAQQGGQGKKVTFAYIPHDQIFNYAG